MILKTKQNKKTYSPKGEIDSIGHQNPIRDATNGRKGQGAMGAYSKRASSAWGWGKWVVKEDFLQEVVSKLNPEKLVILYSQHMMEWEQGQGANIPHAIEFGFHQRAMGSH